jgi:hypothetical protein
LIFPEALSKTAHEGTVHSLIHLNISLVDTVTKLASHAHALELGGTVLEGTSFIGTVTEFRGASITRAVVLIILQESGKVVIEDSSIRCTDDRLFGVVSTLLSCLESLEETACIEVWLGIGNVGDGKDTALGRCTVLKRGGSVHVGCRFGGGSGDTCGEKGGC